MCFIIILYVTSGIIINLSIYLSIYYKEHIDAAILAITSSYYVESVHTRSRTCTHTHVQTHTHTYAHTHTYKHTHTSIILFKPKFLLLVKADFKSKV